MKNGIVETVHGDYISLKLIGRIIPESKSNTAVCKDFSGNRIAVIPWPNGNPNE